MSSFQSVLAEALRDVMVTETVFPGSSKFVSEKLATAIATHPRLAAFAAVAEAGMALMNDCGEMDIMVDRERNDGTLLSLRLTALSDAVDALLAKRAFADPAVRAAVQHGREQIERGETVTAADLREEFAR